MAKKTFRYCDMAALKRIGRYLAGTRNAARATSAPPKNDQNGHLSARVDADFAGSYGKSTAGARVEWDSM
eukprot:296225-Lingulodinium_polyedra.AAC.1